MTSFNVGTAPSVALRLALAVAALVVSASCSPTGQAGAPSNPVPSPSLVPTSPSLVPAARAPTSAAAPASRSPDPAKDGKGLPVDSSWFVGWRAGHPVIADGRVLKEVDLQTGRWVSHVAPSEADALSAVTDGEAIAVVVPYAGDPTRDSVYVVGRDGVGHDVDLSAAPRRPHWGLFRSVIPLPRRLRPGIGLVPGPHKPSRGVHGRATAEGSRAPGAHK